MCCPSGSALGDTIDGTINDTINGYIISSTIDIVDSSTIDNVDSSRTPTGSCLRLNEIQAQ